VTGVHVFVRLGAESYALSVDHVLEVVDGGGISPLPGAGPHVMGVRNLRGQVVPVVDLARVLEVPDGSAPQRMVIAQDAGRKAGLAVDEVIGVEELPEASEEATSSHVAGAALVDGALVGLVDVPSILDAIQGSSEQ
jgi:purine-binding chemotaxis protein CheW